MNRAHFNTLSPYAVGFDRMIDRIFDHQDQATGFPPFNIVKKTDTNFRIELALAGYKEEDLDIQYQESVLTITGDKDKSTDDEGYLHRGISGRKFTRKFTLADDIIVQDAELEDGMLTIRLERIIPEEKRPRTIGINTNIQKSFLTED